jgi:tryptophanyl-tRNA synthetase
MSIVTDSTPVEAPKNPDTDNVFAIYKLIASSTQTEALKEKYLAGNFGYGHAKQELFELIVDKYSKEREAFNFYMSNPEELERKLKVSEEKASIIARNLLDKVRAKLGYAKIPS